jgi:signal transduction histidine kinase
MELGADDYITKPFTHHELLTAIRTRLEKKAIIEQTYQHDIQSLREALEIEQEQRLLKSKLVAMVSHDFRNPLSSILSSAGLLKNYSDQLDEESRLKYFDFIEMSVVQLQQMLDDMLVVAQMESTKFEIKPTLVNINQFVKRIVEEFRVIHTDTHIIHFDSDFNDDFMIDQRLFRQIIANLISNAIKYSSNEAEVRVALAKNSEDLILQVQDQGIGIAQADLEKLFVDFHRGANVGTIAGTGLGLAIVKQAVDLHGGAIHVESEVNEGTTVTVRLPL